MKHEGIPFEQLGIDLLAFSPTSRDLVTRLADSPGTRAAVRKLYTVAIEPKDSQHVKRALSFANQF